LLSLLWAHPLLIPSYLTLASIVLLVLHVALSFGPLKRLLERIFGTVEEESAASESSPSATQTSLVSAVKEHVEALGGSIIFSLQVFRLVLILALLGLSIFSFVQEEEQQRVVNNGLGTLGKHWGKKRRQKHRHGSGSLSDREWLDLALSLTYVRGTWPYCLRLT
jgi:hypothetical protein